MASSGRGDEAFPQKVTERLRQGEITAAGGAPTRFPRWPARVTRVRPTSMLHE